ncbi:MAG: hypothetical protein WCJ57_01200 [Candidatus Falkowbacteria bacterium]
MGIERSEQEFNWQTLRQMTPEELMKIEWLKDEVKKNSLEDLILYNPAIESVINLIKGNKSFSSDQKAEKTPDNFEYLLEKEKMFALINKYEKESLKFAKKN